MRHSFSFILVSDLIGYSSIVPAAMRFSICHSAPTINASVLFAKPAIHRPRTGFWRFIGPERYWRAI